MSVSSREAMQQWVLQTWRTELAKVGGSLDASGDAVHSEKSEHESYRIDAGVLCYTFWVSAYVA